jgi:hypothetical protein
MTPETEAEIQATVEAFGGLVIVVQTRDHARELRAHIFRRRCRDPQLDTQGTWTSTSRPAGSTRPRLEWPTGCRCSRAIRAATSSWSAPGSQGGILRRGCRRRHPQEDTALVWKFNARRIEEALADGTVSALACSGSAFDAAAKD